MFKIKKDYNYYKKCATEVVNCLSQYGCTTLKDIKVIYNLLMGFAYCLDGQKYIYKGKLYNSIEELPKSAHEELLYKAKYLQFDDVVNRSNTNPPQHKRLFKQLHDIESNREILMNKYQEQLSSPVYDDPLGIISEKEYLIEQQKYLNKFMQRYKK